MTQSVLKTSADKLAALRAELHKRGVDGFIVPRADEYQGEYVPARAERLKWLTGFTGSAGTAAVLPQKAMVISDGRYTLQLAQQVDATLFDTQNSSDGDTLAGWLAAQAAPGTKIGYDPRVMTGSDVDGLRAKLKAKNIELVALDSNPLDAVWADQPAAPMDKVSVFPDAVAGRSAADKRADIAQAVNDAGGTAMVLTMPDSIAWLLNIRGTDVPHVPTALSYAVVHGNGDVDWFIPAAKITPEVRQHLGNHVRVREPAELAPAMAALAQAAQNDNKPVLLDPATSADWFRRTLAGHGAKVAALKDPCVLPKAIKTKEEQAAIIDAHVRDGAAMARFLKWVDDNAPGGGLTELDVEAQLLKFRQKDADLSDTSFDTIAGWAGNGAIVHYRATPATNATIMPPGILLIDSGGQYKSGGTTDITRTVAVGKPTQQMKEHFTLVLKGHIAVATARFPEGTKGPAIDAMARRALWDRNLDYDHGTGHGVGCYLAVHEEACGISTREGAFPFRPGMLISNEPGYYRANAYGIRIENLVLVKEDGAREGSKRKMLAFDTVTLAPIDRRLVAPELLDAQELAWLNDYHDRVYKTVAPLVEADVAAWLKQACAPLKKNLSPAARPAGPQP
jgi:Xaa-Pro aminopeptidase